jgi:hypothetical protein
MGQYEEGARRALRLLRRVSVDHLCLDHQAIVGLIEQFERSLKKAKAKPGLNFLDNAMQKALVIRKISLTPEQSAAIFPQPKVVNERKAAGQQPPPTAVDPPHPEGQRIVKPEDSQGGFHSGVLAAPVAETPLDRIKRRLRRLDQPADKHAATGQNTEHAGTTTSGRAERGEVLMASAMNAAN